MKKRMSKILSMLLISALVVSAGSVAEAADMEGQTAQVQEADGEAAPAEDKAEAVPAEKVKEEVPAAVEGKAEVEKAEVEKAEAPVKEAEEVPEMGIDALSEKDGNALDSIDASDLSVDLDAQFQTTKDIPVKMAETGNEDMPISEMAGISYSQEDVKGNGICGYSQKFEAPAKGTLRFSVGVAYGTKTIFFGIFKDENMTQRIDYYSVSGVDNLEHRIFKIPDAGTYYIGVYSTCSGTTPVNQIAAAGAIFYNGGDRGISNGQMVVVGQKDAQTNYFSFKAVKTGYLKITGDTNSTSYKAALCNSSKKALSGDTYFSKNPTYGVTKGKTYYIRINSNYNSSPGYRFKVDNVGISEKSGKTQSKAVNIKKGKTVKGTIQAGSSQADWYKFKLAGKKKVTINVTTGSNDALKIIVYKGKKKVGNGSTTAYNNATGKLYSTTKWSKGTYYIKVQRANKNSSGYYTLKWK